MICVKEGLPVLFAYVGEVNGIEKFNCISSASICTIHNELKEKMLLKHNECAASAYLNISRYTRMETSSSTIFPSTTRINSTTLDPPEYQNLDNTFANFTIPESSKRGGHHRKIEDQDVQVFSNFLSTSSKTILLNLAAKMQVPIEKSKTSNEIRILIFKQLRDGESKDDQTSIKILNYLREKNSTKFAQLSLGILS